MKKNELLAVFIMALASLLFEITVTKIFEYSVWAHYAYMVVSTAMFGLGLSGVILARWPTLLQREAGRFLSTQTALSGVSMFLAFIVINEVPIHMPDAPRGWMIELRNTATVFLALGVPFVFFGLVIGYLFDRRGTRANVYYFADLLGAGIGSFLLVPLIPLLEPQGLVALCAFSTLGAAALFMLSAEPPARPRRMATGAALVLVIVLTAIFAPHAARLMPLNVHVPKRHYMSDLLNKRIEVTGWSALSRVDIATSAVPYIKHVWIAGGVNDSSIMQFDGNFKGLIHQRAAVIDRAREVLDYHALPHLSKTNHTACVIGTSGGGDSLYTLMMGARHVTGIEMDPMIANFVTNRYRAFAGGLFTDGDYSSLVVDEGRSYLRRCTHRFDVIQQVNNYTPIAFQNGALNLSEAYLLTVDSFREFYDHLTDDGIFAVSRYNSVRMATTAVEMFRRLGMTPEEYAKHIVICQGPVPTINTFMFKRSAFTKEELDAIQDLYSLRTHRSVLYDPYRPGTNLYYKIITADNPRVFWRMGAWDFSPPTDNRPFFNHNKHLGLKDSHKTRAALAHILPEEIQVVEQINVALDKRIPRGDIPPLLILIEAAFFATIFFGLPMLSKAGLRQELRRHRRALGYFACLGIAFIMIEICLMQKLVLFLGAPVYSIAAVLCSLLVFAGLGSLVSGRLPALRRTLNWLLPGVAATVLIVHFLTPAITHAFLGAPLPARIMIALLVTGISGFVMGMPMPTGIRFLAGRHSPGVIPWAWAANGYFTVIGSALSVLLVVSLGFNLVFIIAAIVYAIAPLFLTREEDAPTP